MELICPNCARTYSGDAKFCEVDGIRLVPTDRLRRQIRAEELKQYLHPSEESRFMLALIVCVPAALLALLATFFTYGIILIYVGLLAFGVWFGLEVLKANLTANTVRVSKHNFPEVHEVLLEVKHVLDFKENIGVFVVEAGTVNALLAKFFRTKFIILNSELVREMIQGKQLVQMQWIIARFIGALQAKHYRLDFLRILIESIEKIKIFNFFILPYYRATQYSGDQIGLAVCEDLRQAILAFDKFMVGNALANKVSFQGLVQQGLEIRSSLFAMIARLLSTHPHLISRYLNLLAFARQQFPQLYEEYVASLDDQTVSGVNKLLPAYGH